MRTNTRRPRALVKVAFRLDPAVWDPAVWDPAGWHGGGVETVWAEALGSDRYRIKNTPFCFFDISAEDVVFAREDEGRLVFASLLMRGGHSTYRLLLVEGMESHFGIHWRPLQGLGCSYEQGPGGIYAVDVPASCDIYEVRARLELGAQAGVWELEEAHSGHPR